MNFAIPFREKNKNISKNIFRRLGTIFNVFITKLLISSSLPTLLMLLELVDINLSKGINSASPIPSKIPTIRLTPNDMKILCFK